MTSLLLVATLLAQAPKTTARPGSEPPYAVTIQGSATGVPIPISGTVNSAGAADTVGTSNALNVLNEVCSVAMAGQGGAGMFLAAGTLAGTLVPEYSTDNGTTWAATEFIDMGGTRSSELVLTNPNAATHLSIVVVGGARQVRVRLSAVTSGTATCTLVATTATSAAAAASGGGSSATQYDEDTAATSGESLNMMGVVRKDTRATIAGTDGDRTELQVNASGDLRVDGSAVTQPVSGTFWQATQPVSGTVTANAGTGTFTVGDGSGALNVIVDSGALTATVTDGAGALNVIVDSITAGDNNIGNVDVVTLPALAAGNNNVGDVDVASIAAGNNNIGDVDVATLPNEGQQTAANSISVTPDTDNDAIGATAAAVPGEAMFVAGTDGTNVTPWYVDPCQREAKSVYVVNVSTATTTEIANAVASEFFYVCSINLVAAAADNVAIVEDDTDACASPTAGLNGGTTAASGWNFAANGGLTLGNGESTVMKTATANRYLCIITSAATQLSGTITYVSAP